MTRPAVPLRPWGIAEILDGAVRLVRRNLPAVLVISLPFAVARALATAVAQYATFDSGDAVWQAIIVLLLAVAFGVILDALLAPLFSSDLLGTRLTAGQSVARLGWRTVSLIGLALIVPVAEGAGVVTFGVVSVWLWGVWAVAGPALALERLGAWAALRRSFRLVQRSFWRTWGIRALGWVLTSVLGFFVSAPFEALAGYLTGNNPLDTTGNAGVSSPGLYVAVLAIGTLLAAALLGPVAAAVDVLLYTDLRMRREGLDIVLALPPAPAAVAVGRP